MGQEGGEHPLIVQRGLANGLFVGFRAQTNK